MVDEYQDTNRPQYLLIQALTARHRNLCVVGDPDQSIYKWRGADLRNILDFEHDYPEAVVVKLERNYRSTQVILDAASAVIAQNRNRKEKRLYTETPGGQKVQLYRGGRRPGRGRVHRPHVPPRGPGRRQRPGRRAVSHQRAVAHHRGRAAARQHRLQDHRRRPVLRAQGDQGHAGLSAAGAQPARRRQPAARHQRAGARHRQGRDGLRSRRWRRGWPRAQPAPCLRGCRNRGRRRSGRSWNAPWTSAWWRREGRDGAGGFRNLVLELAQIAREDSVAICVGKVLDRSGYLKDLRDEHSEEAEGRIENLAELVSAARESSRAPRAVARRLRRPVVAAVGRRRGIRREEPAGADDDPAQRQGPRVPDRHHRRPRCVARFHRVGPEENPRSPHEEAENHHKRNQ